MGRVLGLLLVVMLAVAEPSHAISEWVGVARTVSQSGVSIQSVVVSEGGEQSFQTICSGFAIDETRQLFMTANHCLLSVYMKVDWQIATIVYMDSKLDLAVLKAEGVRRPALKPRTTPLVTGLEAGALGHAYGYEVPQFRIGYVAHPLTLIPELKDDYTVFSQSFIGGMSGGPIVDLDGKLMGIVQRGNGYNGLGKPIEVILAATAAFWQGQN